MDRLISEQAIVDVLRKGYFDKKLQSTKDDPCVIDAMIDWAIRQIKAIPSTEPKTGHWIRISPAEIYECSECGQNVMTSDICAYKFCHGCGAKMVEPQERSE